MPIIRAVEFFPLRIKLLIFCGWNLLFWDCICLFRVNLVTFSLWLFFAFAQGADVEVSCRILLFSSLMNRKRPSSIRNFLSPLLSEWALWWSLNLPWAMSGLLSKTLIKLAKNHCITPEKNAYFLRNDWIMSSSAVLNRIFPQASLEALAGLNVQLQR